MADIDLTFISKQLSTLIERVGRIETRLDSMEARFDSMEARFEKLENNFKRLDIKLMTIRGEVRETTTTMQSIAKMLVDHGMASLID